MLPSPTPIGHTVRGSGRRRSRAASPASDKQPRPPLAARPETRRPVRKTLGNNYTPSKMRSRAGVLRAVALLSVGAIVLHQLRFTLAYGHSAGEALALQGHSYLPLVEALVAVVFAASLLWFIRSLVLARITGSIEPDGLPFTRLWGYASSALVAVYTLQEGLEGEFSPGHPAGLVGIFGQGGWTAIPLAIAIGALIALLLEGARRTIIFISARTRLRLPRPRRALRRRLPAGFPKLDVLSHSVEVRGPPLLFSR
jgi:hypothetical protein